MKFKDGFYLVKRHNSNQMRSKQSRQTEVYKIAISMLFGLLGFLGAFFSIQLDYGGTKLNIIWSLIFPFIITMAWGIRYGCISLFLGLAILFPYYPGRYNGWANLACSFSIFIWTMLQGYGSEKRPLVRKFYTNGYFLQMIHIMMRIILYFTAFPFLYHFNPPFWFPAAHTTIKQSAIIVIASKNIITEFILFAVSDALLFMPVIRKIFRLERSKAQRYNTRIILSFIAGGLYLTLIILTFNYCIIDNQHSFQWLLYPDTRISTAFLLAGCLSAVMGGMVARIFQSKLQADEDYMEARAKQEESKKSYKLLFDKMMNGLLVLEPVYSAYHEIVEVIIVDVNPGFEKLTGLNAAEIIGKTWLDVFKYKNTHLSDYQRVLKTGESFQYENYNLLVKQFFKKGIFKINDFKIGAIFENITERKKAEEDLLKLNTELEQRVTTRTEELQTAVNELEAFVYTVSHDLKSPLRAIEGYNRIILEDYEKDMEQNMAEILSNVRKLSSDMIAMINKLLQYSTTSKLPIHKEPVHIEEMFRLVFHDLQSSVPERKMELVIDKQLPDVMADEVLLKQIVYNIMSNAVKFTKSKEMTIITVGCQSSEEEHVFYVRDNGVGFDMEYSDKLFGIFQRLHSLEEYEGNGIGLATVRKIIQKHGGRAWIEGRVDDGATVYFTLPIQ